MTRFRLAVFVLTALFTVALVGGVLAFSGLFDSGTTVRSDAPRRPATPSRSVSPIAPEGVATTTPPEGRATQTPPESATSAPRRTPKEPTNPKPARAHYLFPVADCEATYAREHHDYPAADVFAARGCAFVAPVAGRVDEVTRADSWDPATNRGPDRGGLSVSIVGVDGVRYYGSHLQSVPGAIAPGVPVKGGQVLGRIGDTGSARGTGTHLHFGISWPTRPGHWWVRRGTVAPQPYLDAWRAGRELSPAPELSERVTAMARAASDRSVRRGHRVIPSAHEAKDNHARNTRSAD